jgi:hypothetical protein
MTRQMSSQTGRLRIRRMGVQPSSAMKAPTNITGLRSLIRSGRTPGRVAPAAKQISSVEVTAEAKRRVPTAAVNAPAARSFRGP